MNDFEKPGKRKPFSEKKKKKKKKAEELERGRQDLYPGAIEREY
ncbi:MAG TPA: hypothetical protein VJK05_05685 [archaeon]|nr:hypothetical protein [archaeon]